jgi:hypothetical protein
MTSLGDKLVWTVNLVVAISRPLSGAAVSAVGTMIRHQPAHYDQSGLGAV